MSQEVKKQIFFEKLHVTTDPKTEHKPVNMKLIKIDFFPSFFGRVLQPDQSKHKHQSVKNT